MSVVAMESQCMEIIMKHLVDKSDLILSDHKTRYKSLQLFQLSLQSLEDCDFPALSLASRKFKLVVITNLAKRLAPYFNRWCGSAPCLAH